MVKLRIQYELAVEVDEIELRDLALQQATTAGVEDDDAPAFSADAQTAAVSLLAPLVKLVPNYLPSAWVLSGFPTVLVEY